MRAAVLVTLLSIATRVAQSSLSLRDELTALLDDFAREDDPDAARRRGHGAYGGDGGRDPTPVDQPVDGCGAGQEEQADGACAAFATPALVTNARGYTHYNGTPPLLQEYVHCVRVSAGALLARVRRVDRAKHVGSAPCPLKLLPAPCPQNARCAYAQGLCTSARLRALCRPVKHAAAPAPAPRDTFLGVN